MKHLKPYKLNENIENDLAIVKDITNLVKDAGYNVILNSSIKYIVTINDGPTSPLIEDYKEFMEVCQDVKRRLEGHGLLDNNDIHFIYETDLSSSPTHSPFVAFNFYETVPRSVKGIFYVRFWLNIGYKPAQYDSRDRSISSNPF